MELVDRFLSTCPPEASHFHLKARENYQLLSIAAFYVSVKTMERTALGSDFLALVSDGVYTKEDIERTELELLHGLVWKVNPPTPMQFAGLILSLLTPHIGMHDELVARVLDEISYQVESSVRDYNLSQERSSSTAVAAMFNAAYLLLDSGIRQEFLLALSCILVGNFAHPKELQKARLRLQRVLDRYETTNNDTKYLPNEYENDATQAVAALDVSAVYNALNDSMMDDAQNCKAFTNSREEQTCGVTGSLMRSITSVNHFDFG